MNELEFIARLRDLPLHKGARGLEDDCAVLPFGSETLILTHDAMARGTHFRRDADMADVAWKLVAVNLSDLASKGAEPIGIMLGAVLGGDEDRFLQGLKEALEAFDVPLLGGDTIAGEGCDTFGITAIGRATHMPVPSRRGAQIGDGVYVTGTIGRAMLGFEGDRPHLNAFNRPQARLDDGRLLAPFVNAMMDVSDGLLLDAWRMAQASGVAFHLSPELIPVADQSRFDECVRWGDDYELLFTAPPSQKPPVEATQIGTVAAREEAPIMLGSVPLLSSQSLGYNHA